MKILTKEMNYIKEYECEGFDFNGFHPKLFQLQDYIIFTPQEQQNKINKEKQIGAWNWFSLFIFIYCNDFLKSKEEKVWIDWITSFKKRENFLFALKTKMYLSPTSCKKKGGK